MGSGSRNWVLTILVVLVSTAAGPIARGGQAVSFVVTGRDGQPAAGVALYLPDVRTPTTVPPVVVDQRGEAFVPVVSVVSVGSEVQFTNSDRTSHHVYSFSRPNNFELPLYKGNGRLSRRFTHDGVVVLGCNIHDSMLGYVLVVESTRLGITGPDGHLTLADVPAGRHGVRAWAPGLDRENPPEIGIVEVSDAAPVNVSFQLAVTSEVPAPKKRGSLAGSEY